MYIRVCWCVCAWLCVHKLIFIQTSEVFLLYKFFFSPLTLFKCQTIFFFEISDLK